MISIFSWTIIFIIIFSNLFPIYFKLVNVIFLWKDCGFSEGRIFRVIRLLITLWRYQERDMILLRSSYTARGISRKRVKSGFFQKVCPRHRSEELIDAKKIIPENCSIPFFFLKKFQK